MAGTLEDNAIVYKQQTNRCCPQPTPREFIDSTTFALDFSERKYISVGLDTVTNNFQVTARIVTASRYVNIPVDMLRRIFSMIENIITILTSQKMKSRERLFLKDESITLSKISYRGDNMLVIQSHNFEGSRILMSRDNLLTLQGLESCINAVIFQKMTHVQPIVMDQLEKIVVYLKEDFYLDETSTVNEITAFIIRIHDDLITDNLMKTAEGLPYPCFIPQIKHFASHQLAARWMEKMNEASLLKTLQSAVVIGENDGPTFFDYVNY